MIVFDDGIIGFPDLKHFTLIKDSEKKDTTIMWLQSVEEPAMALTVIDPTIILETYDPEVAEDMVQTLGELNVENTFVLTTITVPHDITKMSLNLKAPIIINTDTNKACQVILEGEYQVKYAIYDLLKQAKDRK